jgi:hypothetical protein
MNIDDAIWREDEVAFRGWKLIGPAPRTPYVVTLASISHQYDAQENTWTAKVTTLPHLVDFKSFDAAIKYCETTLRLLP